MTKHAKSIRRPWQPKAEAYDDTRVRVRWIGYQTPRWRKISRLFKDNNPICCFEDCNQATYYADHIIPALECDDPYDIDCLQPLCKLHGNQKTGREGAKVRSEGRRG